MNLQSCAFTLNGYLVIGQNPVTRKIYVLFHFKPSGLRYELIIMPLRRVSGHDNRYMCNSAKQ